MATCRQLARTTFQTTPPMATYLLAVYVGALPYLEPTEVRVRGTRVRETPTACRRARTAATPTQELSVNAPRERPQIRLFSAHLDKHAAEMRATLALIVDSFVFFSDFFHATPYALDKLGERRVRTPRAARGPAT